MNLFAAGVRAPYGALNPLAKISSVVGLHPTSSQKVKLSDDKKPRARSARSPFLHSSLRHETNNRCVPGVYHEIEMAGVWGDCNVTDPPAFVGK
jgi:hypothetical protein